MVKKYLFLNLFFFLALSIVLNLNINQALAATGYCYCNDGNNTCKPITYDTDCASVCTNECKPDSGQCKNDQPCPQNQTQNNSSEGTTLQDPLGLNGDVTALWARIIKALLGLVGIASLVAFVYAGFIFLISAGSSEQVKKAKDTMVYAVLGIFISMAAYVILNFVFKALQGSL
jgi:hypothetical protein